MKREQRSQKFTSRVRDWFARHKRQLPWRDLNVPDDTQRAYMILVSEVMLQQTQVPRVEIIFKRFLELFPTIRDLAAASNKDVIIAWRGMGYNSRALRLRDAAKTVVEKFGGKFPSGFEHLLSIKGIGRYTAGAIRNFAFGIPTPCIDTNIRRILHRVFLGPENTDGAFATSDKKLEPLAGNVLQVTLEISTERKTNKSFDSAQDRRKNPSTTLRVNEQTKKRTQDWHAALMDFGSAVCKKSNPRCDICPMAANGVCRSAFKVPQLNKKLDQKKEPGRLVGSTFVPNRIFRGRIVDALRDAHQGMTLEEIGRAVCIDWSEELRAWLRGLLQKLEQNELIRRRGKNYILA